MTMPTKHNITHGKGHIVYPEKYFIIALKTPILNLVYALSFIGYLNCLLIDQTRQFLPMSLNCGFRQV